MAEASEQAAHSVRETGTVDHADRAYRIFGQAAGRYEGSGTAQAAYIAGAILDARERGEELNASALSESLLGRDDLLQSIITMANNAHEAAKQKRRNAQEGSKLKKIVKRMLEPPGAPMVDMPYAKSTITKIFALADRMSVLDHNELATLLKGYPQAIANNQRNAEGERVGEGELNDQANFMISSHTGQEG